MRTAASSIPAGAVPSSKVVKLRRGESFSFSWKYEAAHGAGRSSLWVHPAIPLQFEFFGGREPAR